MAPEPSEPRTVVHVDPFKTEVGQKGLHNRWHPDIPAYCNVKQGEVFKVECHDWTGGQISNNDNSDDIQNVDLTRIHNLSGPIAVEDAKPGDVLVVDILDVTPFPNMQWGYTGVFERTNGGGLFSNDFDSKAAKAIWDFEGVYAVSRHIPGVRFAGIPHPGLIGTAPSQELLDTWNKRERGLVAEHGDPTPAVALVPNAQGAHIGQDIPKDVRKRIHDEGARTIPGREHGGNVDIKNLSRGSRCYFPVYIDGANLSLGDLHFSQGDGELSFCGAIEMAGIATLKCSVIKDGVKKLGDLKQPIFLPSPIDPMYAQQIIFEGLSVDVHGDGKQYSMDATVAYKQAARNCMAYLRKLGYSKEQAHLLLSAAPIESHVAAIVDVPNACVTMGLPTAIFDRDILPTDDGIETRKYTNAALRSDGVRCKQD
ncbi:hypothetical protein CspHIS471_0610870 [Cutaneotrichosporon sp. HIS471]|nr:hypothetical protein CspHIS471_0610870 [Cutaneotrichosporon sp. HIS471]